ncbi:MAG: tRNA (adenosine(37)-N6)-threonylcarbamoyltransferase complex dimerization subunit type 1 TsaB [Mycoplasmataceae bacterium]|jgi:tRNA threonylcarbamoyl adenosine modification protein YeaZ|nr:tRNA (adenosine(37)-N6)-threonylcarbamoyltransferase complex dimerization subunit type 1 TsaB [Mycoplasmataceae bacterium]
MFSLFIDTTQNYCNLAILNNENIISKFKVKTHNNLTDIVVEHIENLLNKNKLQHEDITKILLVIGPGSFTGVRIGTLIAKTWMLIHKTSVYTIDALRLQTPHGTGLSILDARSDSIFLASYNHNKCLTQPNMMKEKAAESLMKKYQNHNVFIQYKSVDIFNNVIYHLKNFKKVNDVNELKPLYIKKPL